jgi:hypothetical protein
VPYSDLSLKFAPGFENRIPLLRKSEELSSDPCSAFAESLCDRAKTVVFINFLNRAGALHLSGTVNAEYSAE